MRKLLSDPAAPELIEPLKLLCLQGSLLTVASQVRLAECRVDPQMIWVSPSQSLVVEIELAAEQSVFIASTPSTKTLAARRTCPRPNARQRHWSLSPPGHKHVLPDSSVGRTRQTWLLLPHSLSYGADPTRKCRQPARVGSTLRYSMLHAGCVGICSGNLPPGSGFCT